MFFVIGAATVAKRWCPLPPYISSVCIMLIFGELKTTENMKVNTLALNQSQKGDRGGGKQL